MKNVYLRNHFRMHSYLKSWARTPPEGYRLFYNDPAMRLKLKDGKERIIESLAKPLMYRLNVPDKLAGSFVTYFDRPPDDTSLVLTSGLLSLRHEPWIPIIMDDAHTSLVGSPYDLPHTHGLVEGILSRNDCKAIIYFFEANRRSLESTYDVSSFRSKLRYVPLGIPLIPKRSRTKKHNVNLVFMGSANFASSGFGDVWFYNRGGHIAIKTYLRLQHEFENIILTIRSQVPSTLRRVLEQDPRIRIYDKPLSWLEYSELLWTSDICLLPVRDSPLGSFLDAMNHELPIVTLHMHANAEIVQHGKWGFVCDVPDIFAPIIDNYYVANREIYNKLWKAWINDSADQITDNIVNALRILIKDEELRRQMGKAGRETLTPGGLFSVQRRNAYLKQVLDKATS